MAKGIQLFAGDIIRFNSVVKEVKNDNEIDRDTDTWDSVEFVGDMGYWFTHKATIEILMRKGMCAKCNKGIVQ